MKINTHSLFKYISLSTACLSLCSTVIAAEETPSQGAILDDIDIYGADYGDDSTPIPNDALTRWLKDFHSKLDEARIQFLLEQAYSRTWTGHAADGTPSGQNWYKIHAQMGLNLIRSDRHQGTWIKAELSGSTALDPDTRASSLDDAFGSLSSVDCDIFGDDFYYLPEVLLSQGFANGKGVFMAGVINQTNYIDANSYANTTFGQFTAGPFVNNLVLPLGESNFGFLVQWQFNDHWFAQLGGNMMDVEGGENPFKHTNGKSFNLIGEIGWTHEDAFGIGQGTYRLEPFLFHANGENEAGIAVNFEQDLGKSPFAVFFRAGWSSAESGNPGGAVAQVSGGLIIKKPIELLTGLREADGNYLGLAVAVVKPESSILEEEGVKPHNRETTFQCLYAYSVTPYFMIQPSFMVTKNPAMRTDTDIATGFSLQGILTF